MKIRYQFVLLLLALAAIPILYIIATAVYYNFSTPTSRTFSKSDEINIIKGLDISEEDKELILNTIRNRALNIEDAFIFADGTILISTIQEFENLHSIPLEDFMKTATDPSDGALFQITTIPAKSFGSPLLYVVKFDDADFSKYRHEASISEVVQYAIITLSAAVEIVCIFFALLISHRIAKSITFLKDNAASLADGKFETPISIPKRAVHSNEITDLSATLEELRLTLKDQTSRRNRLIMGVSHDLKTPIAIIKGYTEAISDGVVTNKKKLKSALEIIEQKTNQLEDMIETLIDFVKLNSTEWRNNLKTKDLRVFIMNFAKDAKITCEVFNREVVTSTEIPEGIMLKMDERLFERALTNILSNAIRYSTPGDAIYIKARIKNNIAEISIQDTGMGIPQKDIGQIFDIFYRGTPSRREEGMGIGLSVVTNIIETHGWKIHVESEVGKGSNFIITIPIS